MVQVAAAGGGNVVPLHAMAAPRSHRMVIEAGARSSAAPVSEHQEMPRGLVTLSITARNSAGKASG
jgi:hypothetical protein